MMIFLKSYYHGQQCVGKPNVSFVFQKEKSNIYNKWLIVPASLPNAGIIYTHTHTIYTMYTISGYQLVKQQADLLMMNEIIRIVNCVRKFP